ncbi:hypothetical protein ROZALSC1DRAFT_30829 [Rozella allomycis CSF55]|uniref:CHCH domain-containing protein n=1 Tax=Rozella allomycis (strain CSF55) TaxID=988480 RepID=A0A075B1Z4_ROZAC|nr:hypothetical protein O9G_004341 [Rozella allomycis CSF55]RKP17360.1 hypothetical protein ROZALSC1DRAFT_30829 [Rozella allomycis CSF55]|eukprot:EPZ34991.1 hypothetical protein O9G_004341 [Rozella allomycis CSF55]
MPSPGAYNISTLVKAPIRGSFPLDTQGLCKDYFENYMACLSKNFDHSILCRRGMRDYLKCRMDNDLMDKEDMARLGFADLEEEEREEEIIRKLRESF